MDIRKLRILSSIPTNSIGLQKLPQSMGSGCFVKYDKYTIFLTVYHTVNNNKLVNAIVVDFDEINGVQLLPLGEIDPTIRGNIMTKEVVEVDFAIKILESMPPCHLFDVGQDGIIKFKKKRIQLVSTLTDCL